MVHTIAILFAVKFGLGKHAQDLVESEGRKALYRMGIVGAGISFTSNEVLTYRRQSTLAKSFSYLASHAPSYQCRCFSFDWQAVGDIFVQHGFSVESSSFGESLLSLESVLAPLFASRSCQNFTDLGYSHTQCDLRTALRLLTRSHSPNRGSLFLRSTSRWKLHSLCILCT